MSSGADDHDHGVPRMTDADDLSRFLLGGGGGWAAKLDDVVVVHAFHNKLLSSSAAACTGGEPPEEETPQQHPDLMFSLWCPVVVVGRSDAAMARSFNNSSSWMISMATTPSSSKESLGQHSSLWRMHGHGHGPPPSSSASQSATSTSSLPRPERHES
jgi:hypothetical protein